MDDALAVASGLAVHYGHRADRPLMYMQGVAIGGRLRLAALDGTLDPVTAEVAELVAETVENPNEAFDPRFGLAGLTGAVWAEEMFEASGDDAYKGFLLGVTKSFDLDALDPFAGPLDADVRVEDFFFASALLGRAFALTGDDRFLDAATRYLVAADTQQPNGLYWHCDASPFFWGRGNAFAALGFAEMLTYLPNNHAARDGLLARHLEHLAALRELQDASGMWRQVVDDPATYLEHSATTMITCAIARGIRLGWLDEAEWTPVVERAWSGITRRVGAGGELEHVCVGTGPLEDIDGYVGRPYTDGTDDRGGAMALWCAVEVERLRRGT